MDVEVRRDTELNVAHVEGVSDAGVELVDAFVAPELEVVDAARIIVPIPVARELVVVAREQGLVVDELDVTPH